MSHEFAAGFAAHDLEHLRQLFLKAELNRNWTLIDALGTAVWDGESAKPAGLEKYVEKLRDGTLGRAIEDASNIMTALGLETPERLPLRLMPAGSFTIRLNFELETPYISKDDRIFSLVDNAVRKDKVFRVPMVSGSTWKGALRSAVRIRAADRLEAIFGPESGAVNDNSEAGRLQCLPTFFKQVGSEMINPHSRKTRTGNVPVRIECVPAGQEGRLLVMYVNRPGPRESLAQAAKRAAGDLPVVAAGCARMLREGGFGAKKTSGYGAAKDALRAGKSVFEP